MILYSLLAATCCITIYDSMICLVTRVATFNNIVYIYTIVANIKLVHY